MHVALPQPGDRLADEPRVLLQFGDRLASAIAHTGTKAPDQLKHDVGERSLVRHAAFDAFRHQLGLRPSRLTISIFPAPFHRADGAHPPVHLVRAGLIQHRFSGRLLRAGEQAPDHDCRRAGGQRLGHVARKLDAAVRNHRHAGAGGGLGALGDRRELRHAGTGHDACGADRPRTNPDLESVHAGFQQILRRLGGRNVARRHLQPGIFLLQQLDPVQHRLRMAMGCIHHDQIHACFHQQVHPLIRIRPDADGRAHAQPPMFVLAGIRVFDTFFDVLDGDQALQLELLVDDRQFLDAVLVEDLPGLLQRRAFRRRHELLPFHDLRHLQVHPRFEPEIAVGENPDQLAVLRDRNPGNAVTGHQLMGVPDGLIRRDRHGIENHPAFRFLHAIHLGRLIGRREHPVHDPDPSLPGHRDREAGFRDRVHRRAHDRDVHPDGSGHHRARIDLIGQHVRPGRHQDHVIERQTDRGIVIQHESPVGACASAAHRTLVLNPQASSRMEHEDERRPADQAKLRNARAPLVRTVAQCADRSTPQPPPPLPLAALPLLQPA